MSQNNNPFGMHEPRILNVIRNNRQTDGGTNSETSGCSAVFKHPDITNVAEYIKNKLYFAILDNKRKEARGNSNIHFFNVDYDYIYNNFYNDFGPLNIACLYRYCCKVNKKIKNVANKRKCIVHYTSQDEHKRTNAAYLITSYAVLYLKKCPMEAYKLLNITNCSFLKPFQDVSLYPSTYTIDLSDCLSALYKAACFGFFNFEDFDVAEYEKYEQMRYGDLNWIVPQKFLAFVGPSTETGTVYHPPECYINYFLQNGVTTVVRLNRKTYDASRFTKVGIAHYDMFMPDGSVPQRKILNQFLGLAESTTGPIAVHCKAGLGRTGTLIAAYLIKHYKMTARESIAWIRICRPGSVIGHQQTWLEKMENSLVNAGEQYRLQYRGDRDTILHHKHGIYSIVHKLKKNTNYDFETYDRVYEDKHNKLFSSKISDTLPTDRTNETRFTRILKKLRGVTGAMSNTTEHYLHSNRKNTKCNCKETDVYRVMQGDRLNEIKMNRSQSYVTPGVENIPFIKHVLEPQRRK